MLISKYFVLAWVSILSTAIAAQVAHAGTWYEFACGTTQDHSNPIDEVCINERYALVKHLDKEADKDSADFLQYTDYLYRVKEIPGSEGRKLRLVRIETEGYKSAEADLYAKFQPAELGDELTRVSFLKPGASLLMLNTPKRNGAGKIDGRESKIENFTLRKIELPSLN